MSASQTENSTPNQPRAVFATTHWSVVLAARDADSTCAREALSRLCQTYWYPLYAYARRCGNSPHDAQDLTQAFFAQILEENWVAKSDPQRGRFRSFLLSSMRHFMVNEWKKENRQKRGGGQTILSLNDDSAENRYQLEPMEKRTPEVLFERGWALSLLDSVLAKLEAEYRSEGKSDWMEVMRPALTSERGSINYAEIAKQLALTETTARVAVHRLRQQYRKMLRAEVAHTVAAPEEVDEELRHLFKVLTEL
jgi:RNA polymerase sigma-70 factor (ECF subfamily)